MIPLRTDLAKDIVDIQYWYFEWYVLLFGAISIVVLAYTYYKQYMNNRCDKCKSTDTSRYTSSLNMLGNAGPKYKVEVTCNKCNSTKSYFK